MSLIRGKEMTVADATKALGISDSNLRQRIHEGRYPKRKVGTRIVVEIPLEELRLAEERHKQAQAGTTTAVALLNEDEAAATRYTQAIERIIRPYVMRIARLEEQLAATQRDLMSTREELRVTERRLLRYVKEAEE